LQLPALSAVPTPAENAPERLPDPAGAEQRLAPAPEAWTSEPAVPASAATAAEAGSQSAGVAAETPTAVAEPPAAASPGIVFEFTAPCWVDVRDTKRNFKLFGEMPKGTRKVLGGEPPYQVVLGNASAVRVTVDGVPYDIAQHARGNVARFTLDPPRSSE
jgi:cytoskeleton protein RodZ